MRNDRKTDHCIAEGGRVSYRDGMVMWATSPADNQHNHDNEDMSDWWPFDRLLDACLHELSVLSCFWWASLASSRSAWSSPASVTRFLSSRINSPSPSSTSSSSSSSSSSSPRRNVVLVVSLAGFACLTCLSAHPIRLLKKKIYIQDKSDSTVGGWPSYRRRGCVLRLRPKSFWQRSGICPHPICGTSGWSAPSWRWTTRGFPTRCTCFRSC